MLLSSAALALIDGAATAQQLPPAVIKSSSEYLGTDSRSDVQDVYLNSNNSLVVVAGNGEKSKFRKRDVFWGYRNKDGVAFRFFGGKTYKVLETQGLTIYSAPTTAIVGDLLYNEEQFYFSDGLDSPIYKLEFGELRSVFGLRAPMFIALVEDKLRSKTLSMKNEDGFVLVALYTASVK